MHEATNTRLEAIASRLEAITTSNKKLLGTKATRNIHLDGSRTCFADVFLPAMTNSVGPVFVVARPGRASGRKIQHKCSSKTLGRNLLKCSSKTRIGPTRSASIPFNEATAFMKACGFGIQSWTQLPRAMNTRKGVCITTPLRCLTPPRGSNLQLTIFDFTTIA